ncbi:MAG: HAD hydrolase-like protein [Clostridia bacterium]|nr:HAD hydrolase-like protein [Clostridia bacterium]
MRSRVKKYILFDLDGTLTDPKEGITKCVQYALEYFGIYEPDLEKLVKFIGPPLDVSFSEYYGMSEADASIAVDKYRERFSSIGIFENGLYEGIIDMLKALKKSGRCLALATSKPDVFAVRIVEKYGIAPYLDVLAGGKIGGSCNKEDVIAEALDMLGVTDNDKQRVIMVGDRKHDIIGAKKCCIESVGVRFGYAEEGELEKAGADYIVSTVEELEKLLLSV